MSPAMRHIVDTDRHAKCIEVSKRLRCDIDEDLIGRVAAVDGILQMQAGSDADYFLMNAGSAFTAEQAQPIRDTVLKADRRQYIVSDVQDPRLLDVLGSMITAARAARVDAAPAPIVQS